MQKKTKVLLAIVTVLMICLGGYLAYLYYLDCTTLPFNLTSKEYTMEYGDDISSEIKDYIKDIDEKRYNDEHVEFIIPEEAINGKVGEYDCDINWSKVDWYKENLEFIIKIQDTNVPEIEFKKDTVSIDYGETYNLKNNIKSVKDKIDGDLKYEIIGKLDSKKSGTQTFKVTATDVNGNKTEKEFKVKVGNKPVVKQPTVSKPSSSSSSNNKTQNTTPSVNQSYPMTYQDVNSKITVYKEWYGNAWVYAAHIQTSDYDRIGTSCAKGVYGGSETTYQASKRLGAILTINGCYSSPNLGYPVARGGKVYNNKNCWVPAVYNANNGKLMSAWDSGGTPGIAGHDLQTLVNEGKVTDTFSFGPPILSGGVIQKSNGGGRAQRTFIGTNGAAGDIWLVVSDGRYVDGVSAGLTYTECAQYLQSKGCTFGVPLDGGGSSTMVFQGKILNKTSGRYVVDFVYFK